jgi:hypothetical protein
MKIPGIGVLGCLLATSLVAQPQASRTTLSPMDKQIASLKIDVPRIREIMKLVATNDSQPTKPIHDEFWGLILTRIHADPMDLETGCKKEIDNGMFLQIAFWNSLRLSAQFHRIIMTNDFIKLRNNYAKAKFTSDYNKVQNAMLNAAASGHPYIFRNGQSAHITLQLANQTLARMNAAHARFDKLCDPNWTN